MEGKKGLQKRRTGIKEVEKTELGLLVYGFWRKFGSEVVEQLPLFSSPGVNSFNTPPS